MIEEIVKKCLHQVFKPKYEVYVTLDNIGNCSKCVYDEDNKYCDRFVPITLYIIDIQKV